MMRSVPPRLRAPLSILAGGAAIAAIVPAAHDWKHLLGLGLVTVVSAAAWYLAGGRDSDFGALMRDKADERQAYRRLKAQALVGIVMSATAVVVNLAAMADRAPLWPLEIFVFVPAVTFVVGWAIYREPGGGQDEGTGDRITG
jgi:hypothetical protein